MKNHLKQAIELSRKSVELGGFPVGAIVVKDDEIIGEGISDGKNKKDATSHAEIEAIRSASEKLDKRNLIGCEIYSSMEPCLMCLSATYWAKIRKITYAIGRDKLSKEHFEGTHSIEQINSKINQPIEIVHVKELEAEALAVIERWEELKKNN